MNNPNFLDDGPPATPPQTPPPTDIGQGHPQYYFTQGLLELQKSFVKTETSIISLSTKVEDLGNKIDVLMDWKAKIVGGTFVLIIVTGALWALIVFGSEYYTLTPKSVLSTESPKSLNPAQKKN